MNKILRLGVKTLQNHTITYFVCHRSGKYIPEGKDLRHLKTQGTKKIDGLCPASIRLKRIPNGECNAIFVESHVGHQNDIGHLNLTPLERQNLATKIASKVPFEDILDEIRDSICD